jgi:DNA-binding HxlR family transcriptional regulator
LSLFEKTKTSYKKNSEELALEIRFSTFREEATKFSREIQAMLYKSVEPTVETTTKINLFLAKTLFSKWSIEILAILYSLKTASYGDVKKGAKGITSRVLSQKLKSLENARLIERIVIDTRPPSVRYSLTDKGLTVAKLAEPVFLYTAVAEGLFSQPQFVLSKSAF